MADRMAECPFCKKKSRRADFSVLRTPRAPSGTLIRVVCKCGATSPASKTTGGAFAAWNYRPSLAVESSAPTNTASAQLPTAKVWRLSPDGEYGAVQYSFGQSQGGEKTMAAALYSASRLCSRIEVLPEGESAAVSENVGNSRT